MGGEQRQHELESSSDVGVTGTGRTPPDPPVLIPNLCIDRLTHPPDPIRDLGVEPIRFFFFSSPALSWGLSGQERQQL